MSEADDVATPVPPARADEGDEAAGGEAGGDSSEAAAVDGGDGPPDLDSFGHLADEDDGAAGGQRRGSSLEQVIPVEQLARGAEAARRWWVRTAARGPRQPPR